MSLFKELAMKRTPSDLLQKKRLWMALVLGAVFGASGVAVGADPGTARTADPSEAATATSTAPGKAESADSAFRKLDIGGKGYVPRTIARCQASTRPFRPRTSNAAAGLPE
jgi:hypothetical protein